jgi:hypothetical protein
MQMLYNSENFVVVQFEFPATGEEGDATEANGEALARGGFEIVDKFAQKEIFLEGALAESFKEGVQALTGGEATTVEAMDEYLARFSGAMQQSVVLH